MEGEDLRRFYDALVELCKAHDAKIELDEETGEIKIKAWEESETLDRFYVDHGGYDVAGGMYD